MKAYALWMIPPEPVYGSCAALIDRLAVAHDAPRFEPHLTMIGNAGLHEPSAIRFTEKLASSIQPFPIELVGIGQQDTFFQCLYMRAKQTEALMLANRRAREVFACTDDPPYLPHLSLLYGDLPAAVKHDIADGIDLGEGITFPVDSLHVICASIETPIEDWYRVAEIRLGDPIADN